MDQQIGFCTTEDGVRIAYATYGRVEGDALFVLPDIVGQGAVWKHPNGRALLEELGHGRRLITYDGRGTGSSDRQADFSSLECYARDIAAVLDHLQIERAALFSFGGISSPFALMYASQHRDRVSALVLWGALVVKARVEGIDTASFGRLWPLSARAMATFYFPNGPLEMERWFAKAMGEAQFNQTVGQVMEQQWDLRPLLTGVAAPTLILQRERTQSVDPGLATAAARLLPNATVAILEGDADHPLHDHAQFIEPLNAFLDAHLPRTVDVTSPDLTPDRGTLTPRESEVLSLLAGGHTGKEIAEALGVSLSTVQRHIANIYGKIGARSRVDAAAYALARGLVWPRDR